MAREGIYMDTSLCVECHACRLACQLQNQLPPEDTYIKLKFVERGEFPKVAHLICRQSCLHCLQAPCVEVCPAKAVQKSAQTSLTLYDATKCIGCGLCVKACPFGVPQLKGGKALRCTGCPDLTESGKAPACVGTCITNALKFGEREQLSQEGEKRVAALKGTFPDTLVYSPARLGLLQVLRDKPATFNLP